MSNSFFERLAARTQFNEHQQELLRKELQLIQLKKDEELLRKGAACRSLCFVLEGALVHVHQGNDLNERVIDLSVAGDWVVNHKSFYSQQPSDYGIRAFTDAILYQITIESVHKLIGLSPTFLQLGSVLDEATSRLVLFDANYTPDEKYHYLMQHKPALLQQFPQKIIASYLKITPETLSRVRSRLANA